MLEAKNAFLLVIDIQGNLFLSMNNREDLLQNLTRVIRGAALFDLPIVVTEQTPEKLGPTIPEIAGLFESFDPVAKSAFSCCRDEGFMKRLKSLKQKQVLITGIESHVCVYQTAMDLLRLGYEVQVVEDAVSSRTRENHRIGIEKLIGAGALRTSVEMALFELMRIAEGQRFRQMVRIVK